VRNPELWCPFCGENDVRFARKAVDQWVSACYGCGATFPPAESVHLLSENWMRRPGVSTGAEGPPFRVYFVGGCDHGKVRHIDKLLPVLNVQGALISPPVRGEPVLRDHCVERKIERYELQRLRFGKKDRWVYCPVGTSPEQMADLLFAAVFGSRHVG